MKRIISTIIMTLALSGAAKAIEIETLVLNNGSELHGYIQRQDGNGHISFQSDNATINVLGKDVKAYTNEKAYKVSELDSTWIKWAEANDKFVGVGDNRTLTLYDLILKDKSVSKVFLYERGINVKYYEATPNNYTVAWKDIKCIKCPKRSKLSLSGINVTYQLKSGTEYEGQYAEETDSTLSLYLLDKDMIQTMNLNDVNKYTYSGINPNQSLFEQSPLLDLISTKGGELLKGIIVEKNYTTGKEKEDYFIINSENGSSRTIKIADIVETRREINPSYSPKTDIALEVGDIRINRMKTTIVGAKPEDSVFKFEKVDGVVVKNTNNSATINVEYLNNSGGNAELFQIIRLKAEKSKKKTIYCFSFEDIVNSAIHAKNITTSVNNITTAEYTIGGVGNYALFDSKSKKVIFINVK